MKRTGSWAWAVKQMQKGCVVIPKGAGGPAYWLCEKFGYFMENDYGNPHSAIVYPDSFTDKYKVIGKRKKYLMRLAIRNIKVCPCERKEECPE